MRELSSVTRVLADRKLGEQSRYTLRSLMKKVGPKAEEYYEYAY